MVSALTNQHVTDSSRLTRQPAEARTRQTAFSHVSAASRSNINQVTPKGQSLTESASTLLTPDAQGNVHEEELQHAVVMHLLNEIDPKAAEGYASAFNAAALNTASFEDGVKVALKKVVDEGLITLEQAEAVNGKSFRAAQIDSDLSALFDNKGGVGDNTIAVMQAEEAYKKAEETLRAIESGEIKLEARPLDAPSNSVSGGGSVVGAGGNGGAGGFLWKPVSDSNGNLVVLLPARLSGNIESAGVYSSLPPTGESLIEQGRFSGDTHNGGRAHYRFGKPGASYPDGIYVVARLRNGEIETFQIANTGSRQEG